MSTTFLDAPRSLAVWRRFAVAASLLLGLGVTWTMTRTPDADVRSRAQPLAPDADPRYDVLEPFLSRDGLTTQAGGLPGTPRRGAAGPIGRRLPTIFFLDGNEWRSDPGAGRPRVPPASDDADGEERN